MKIFCCFLICMMAFFSRAQDTIYKRSGELVQAKVFEVKAKEVSYKRLDLMDGPLIIVSKNEIKKIKYASGNIDTFAVFKEPVKVQLPVYQTPVYVLSDPNLIKTSLRKGIYLYQGQILSDRNLISLALKKNVSWGSQEINDHILLYKTNRSVQYIVGYTGVAVGIAGLYGSLLAANGAAGSDDVLYSMAVASTAIGILISSQIVSFSYKIKRVQHSDKVMELYNQFSVK